ncbi:PAS domain S-box protein [candidate division WOR-3 bacterium]|nr:PAS domain S-box protein [candidate division WOR-3 bacterium]
MLGEKHEEISAIAELKSSQIMRWRQDQLSNVEILARSPFVQKAAEDFIARGDSSILREDFFNRLRIAKEVFRYTDVLVTDTFGNTLISIQENLCIHGEESKKTIERALSHRAPALSDLFLCENETIHLDAVHLIENSEGSPFAVLILRNNAEDYLYPVIRDWPTPSKTGEVLLVRKENGEMVFLNHLRRDFSGPLDLKLPLDSAQMPSVQTALGRKDIFIGKDYSGREVLADLRSIGDSPWFIVTKIDTREVFEELKLKTVFLALFSFVCIILAGALTSFIYRTKQTALLKKVIDTHSRLLIQEEHFKSIIESLQEGLIVVDNDDVIRYVNLKFCEMLEYEREELLGKTSHKLLLKEDDFQRILRYNRERQEGKSERYELDMIKKSGETITFLMNAAPTRDSKGEVTGSLSTCLDITQQKKIGRELIESESKYKMLVENMQEGLLFADNNDNIGFINPVLCEKLGYSPDELTGKYGLDILLGEKDRELVRSRTQKRIKGESEQYEIELIKKNGEKAVFLVNAAPMNDINGKTIGSISTLLDITERKKVEKELEKAYFQVLSIFDGIDQPIYVSDPETYELLFVNRATKNIFGKDLSPKCYEYFQGRENPCPFCTNEKIFGDYYGKSYIWEFRNEKNGRWYTCTDKAIEWFDGRVVRYEMAIDITELHEALEKTKETEAKYLQAQKMEAVGRLAGGIAHDFNNMLSVITGNAELLIGKKTFSGPEREGLKEILKASEHSTNLVRQLLAFARKQTVEPTEVNLNKIISDMLNMLKRLIGENIELVWKPANDLWPVFIDPAQIDQIVANLVVNSRDAIKGTGTIKIETANRESADDKTSSLPGFPAGDMAVLSISDDGCGMDKETKDHLFEPFYTTKPKGKGTGLGLSTIYGIVKQNGGYISIYSELGKGTVAKIYLPRSEASSVQKEKTSKTPRESLSGKTILLVEDEESLLKLNLRILDLCGYNMLSAQNPLEALEIARTNEGKIDLLITDVVMPEMSGQELWREIQKIRSETKCLFISGYTADIIDDHGVLKEGIHFLQKPFNKETLSAKIEEIL